MKYRGSCHCGQIAFEVEGELAGVADCNCSICARMGALHWFVPGDKLRPLSAASQAAVYTFGQGTIKHYFCPRCGIHPFGTGVDPAGNAKAAINVRCLDGVDIASLAVTHLDGRSR